MEINILIKKVEKKICDKIKCEKIIIEDKTCLLYTSDAADE